MTLSLRIVVATIEQMRIWVDADACPSVIKDILFRAAERTRIMTTLVANQIIKVPPSSFIRFVQVASGFDVADPDERPYPAA